MCLFHGYFLEGLQSISSGWDEQHAQENTWLKGIDLGELHQWFLSETPRHAVCAGDALVLALIQSNLPIQRWNRFLFGRLRVFHRQITCVQPTLGIGRQWDGSKYMGLPKNREPPNLMVCHHSLVWNCNFAGVPHSQSHPGYPWITIKTPLYI